ncbi:MAG: hypothetical protein WC444_00845 [Candidatus Paceibacterota bacterium]
MNRTSIWWGMFIGSTIGGFIPSLWNAGMFSMTGVFLTAIGGFVGIWAGYSFSE